MFFLAWGFLLTYSWHVLQLNGSKTKVLQFVDLLLQPVIKLLHHHQAFVCLYRTLRHLCSRGESCWRKKTAAKKRKKKKVEAWKIHVWFLTLLKYQFFNPKIVTEWRGLVLNSKSMQVKAKKKKKGAFRVIFVLLFFRKTKTKFSSLQYKFEHSIV